MLAKAKLVRSWDLRLKLHLGQTYISSEFVVVQNTSYDLCHIALLK